MAANPRPLDGDRQLEEACTYRYLEIVVLSTPPRGPKVFVVFVIDPGKSSPTVTIKAARGFLAENDVKNSTINLRCVSAAKIPHISVRVENMMREAPGTCPIPKGRSSPVNWGSIHT
jgi:hypothetical protein